MVPEPLAPLPAALLLQHRHWLLLSHLPRLDPSINRAAGTHINETFGEVAVELREMRLENKPVREKKKRKGAAEYFGANLAHLLNLVQVTDVKEPLPSGRPWRGPPNTISSWCCSGIRHCQRHGATRSHYIDTLPAKVCCRAWVLDG